MRLIAAALLATAIPVASLAQTTPAPAGDAAAPAASATTTAATTDPAAAATSATPAAGAMMPLSEIIAALEARVGADLVRIEEVDWDDDGYWEIEYRKADGSETEVKIDPATGEQRAR